MRVYPEGSRLKFLRQGTHINLAFVGHLLPNVF